MKLLMDHQELKAWVEEIATLCRPKEIYVCDGSEEENQRLIAEQVKAGVFIPLNPKLRPNSYLVRSDPSDVARVESRTFICSEKEIDAGPTNNWKDPKTMRKEMIASFSGCMEGRVLYVIPFSMGPLGSPMSRFGVELTDSPYVVVNMRIMTRMGKEVLEKMKGKPFVKCLHSVGVPLKGNEKGPVWPCNPEKTAIVHFPEDYEIWSYGSGYGGNALLGKKCFALRIASAMGRREGWLAEHMLIVGITNPEGRKRYFAAAFPSACGKTNLAMLESTLPGWKIECVGDDIAWMWFDETGQLRGINPEAGFFGVAPGTSLKSNPNAMRTISKNSIFTNAALTKEGDIWWEYITNEPPEGLISWLGKPWTKESGPAAHANSRFTTPASQCPVIDPLWQEPKGVPISAILFGGRRATTVPLVNEALSWNHGVFMGASLSSEMTAAAAGTIGKLRHDPFAMLPFAGYNMADYFANWFSQAKRSNVKLPKLYAVNWFRKDSAGNFLWNGFGDNIRVLKWIFERCEGKASVRSTPIGNLPNLNDFDVSGLSMKPENLELLFKVDPNEWRSEAKEMEEYLVQFKERVPKEMAEEIKQLKARLG